MPNGHCLRLRIILMLFLPFLRITDTKSIAEDLSDSLQWHSFALRIEENDEQPTNKADSSVKPKGAARRPSLHH